MFQYPETFLNDLYLSNFRLINITTGSMTQVEINENGVLLVKNSEDLGDYTALNTSNVNNYLPLNLYLARPEIQPLYTILMEEIQKIRDGLKNI